MIIETERIIIRSIQRGDEKAYAEMAKDGSLAEIGFDENFSDWAENWINEAVQEYITKTSHTQSGLRTLKIQYFG